MWCLPQREVYFSGWKDLFFPFKFAILKSCSCLNLQYSKAVHASQADALICSSVKNASFHPVGKVKVLILADCTWDALEIQVYCNEAILLPHVSFTSRIKMLLVLGVMQELSKNWLWNIPLSCHMFILKKYLGMTIIGKPKNSMKGQDFWSLL